MEFTHIFQYVSILVVLGVTLAIITQIVMWISRRSEWFWLNFKVWKNILKKGDLVPYSILELSCAVCFSGSAGDIQ